MGLTPRYFHAIITDEVSPPLRRLCISTCQQEVMGTLRPIKVASESLRCRPNSPTQFETRKKLLKC
jgi:hypothetical protein